MVITETAHAKINLALHVRARRSDGYHEIETLFAFVDTGDVLEARPATVDRLESTGEFAELLDDPADNLIMQAMSALPRDGGLHVTLDKKLPVAAGLGGGSADAGAMFRIVESLYGLPEDWRVRAERLGADVPACVASEMAIGSGTGTELDPVENDMAGMAVLLVNPRVPLSTGPVFRAWDGEDRGPLPTGSAREMARNGRNDLRPPAVGICPAIGDVLEALDETDPWMCEMSGSGATCFALFDSPPHRDEAAQVMAEHHPTWWYLSGALR